MSISINNNLMALNTANTLQTHYGRLSTSVERLSSGLRINSAADDAAGLSIRELMRADVAALNQGMRNAKDAISMIQVADGALAIIDEKLIRMKELAEQAATGTYSSTQRLMIDSEYKAMADEIDRIARATDYNGIKLLDGSLSGKHDGKGLQSTGSMKIHFGTANDSAEDYYYVQIGDCTTKGLGLREKVFSTDAPAWIREAEIDLDKKRMILDVPWRRAGTYDKSPAAVEGLRGLDSYSLPAGLKNVTITSNLADPNLEVVHKPHVSLFTRSGTQLTGPPIHIGSLPWTMLWAPVIEATGKTDPALNLLNGKCTVYAWYTSGWWCDQTAETVIQAGIAQGLFDPDAVPGHNLIYDAGYSVTADGMTITMVTSQNEVGTRGMDRYNGSPPTTPKTDEIIFIDETSDDLVFLIGGHAPPDITTNCNLYSLKIEAEITDEFVQRIYGNADPDDMCELLSIETQEKAQKALVAINDAVVSKDKIRAHLGAMQNRLENTVTNLNIQAENMQNAESRISDADVAYEMTNFVRNQILSQSAVAMLGQANTYPHTLLNLIGA